MTTQNFPSKKKFTKKFFSENWKLLFSISYEQATLEEYFEFFEMSEKGREIFLIEKILKNIPLRFHEKIIQKIFPNFLPKRFLVLDFEKIATKMLSEIFTTHESVFSNIKSDGKNSSSQILFSASIAIICEKYHISIIDAVKNLTLEQFLWLQDGAMYLMNAQTEEWQKINNYAVGRNKKSSHNWEEIRKKFNENNL